MSKELAKARRRLVEAAPYLAPIIYLRTPVCTERIPFAAAIDKYGTIYYRPEVVTMPRDKIAAILMHECLHIAFRHFERIGGREPKRWNIAADMPINEAVAEVFPAFRQERQIMWADKFGFPKGLTSEKYYDLLERGEDKNGSGKGNKGQQDFGGGGSCSDGRPRDWESGDEPKGQPGQGQSPEEKRAQLREAIGKVAEEAAKAPGKVPGVIREWAQSGRVNPPLVHWTKLLHRNLREATGGRFTQHGFRESRWDADLLVRRWRKVRTKLDVLIDTSGSVSNEDLGRALEIARSLGATKVHFGDVQLQASVTLDKALKTKEVPGGGGTDIPRCLRDLVAAGVRGTVLVITDCYTPWDGLPNEISVQVLTATTDKSVWPPESGRVRVTLVEGGTR